MLVTIERIRVCPMDTISNKGALTMYYTNDGLGQNVSKNNIC